MNGGLGALVTDGNIVLAVGIALLAGFVSFASPCVLPLVPGFLGYVTGMGEAVARVTTGAQGPVAGAARRRILLGAALFVLGFSVVFITGTVVFSIAGAVLADHRELLNRIGGVVVIALALVFLGVGGRRTWQPSWRPAAGLVGAPLLGAVFAIGWAPCMGPTFGAIATLATSLHADSGQIARGALLGVAYSAGLGVPFLLIAAGWSRAIAASAWLRRHHRAIQLFGGAVLLVVGLLLLTGEWTRIVARVQIALVENTTTIL